MRRLILKAGLAAVVLGAVQMLAPSLATLGPLGAEEFEVFDLPYILPDGWRSTWKSACATRRWG